MNCGQLSIESPEGVRQSQALQPRLYTAGRAESEGNHLTLLGDGQVSRLHFEIEPQPPRLRIKRLASGRNPLFFRGQEVEEFWLEPGESFVVGRTRLSWQLPEQAQALTEFTLAGLDRDQARQRTSYECFLALSRMLPGLRKASQSQQVWRTALEVLRSLLPEAHTIQAWKGEQLVASLFPDQPRPASRRLIARAHEQGCTVTHSWEEAGAQEATVLEQVSWAVASPTEGYTLYAAGSSTPQDLAGRSALVDVVAETTGHHLAQQQYQRLHSQVGQFFSPLLRDLLKDQDLSEVLRPKQAQVTVLFFDLRGFSLATEAAEHDSLQQILHHHETLTEVMTAVTDCIFERQGVVIDYQGDAVLACWGAPHAQPDQGQRAVEAALAILRKVKDMGLRCGMGLGTGPVIAGQVGAREQTKFGIMGRVVNQASRLEGLTKQLGVPILLNSALHSLLDGVLCRYVGLVRPAGLKEASPVYELVVSRQLGGTALTAEQCQQYADGYRRGVPADLPDDPVSAVLRSQMQADWTGILEFRSK